MDVKLKVRHLLSKIGHCYLISGYLVDTVKNPLAEANCGLKSLNYSLKGVVKSDNVWKPALGLQVCSDRGQM